MSKMKVDLDLIEKLADLMEDKGLTEIELEEDDSKIRVKRGGDGGYIAAPMPASPMAAPAAAPGAPGSDAPAADMSKHPGAVSSPMVGTVYLAPQPGAANFVSQGAAVKEGDTVLIIEAMKVMNQIPAPKSGTVTQILVEDGQPVEFGEALVVIE
jgi:acetyl-CoA carboxylase biotin carboxyl carrier protein